MPCITIVTTTTMISKLNIIELSDVHLGHRTTSTEHIIESLNLLINNNSRLAEVDLLIIAGDLFDRLIYLSHPDRPLIQQWMYSLLLLCSKNDIAIRVLEGTPSHDNRQPKFIQDIYEQSDIKCDLLYVDDLHIEYIEKFDINVLYIPDEYHPDHTQTLHEVRKLIAEHGLDKVDFAVMHGAFDYQVPESLHNRIPHHSSKAYLELVRYLIFIGHVHQYSQYQRILSAGSTDRLKHGEEEKKGFIYAEVYNTGEFKAEFIVNHNAKIYKTLDVKGLDFDDALALIQDTVDTIPEESHIRIKAGTNNALIHAIKTFRLHHPQFHWSTVLQKQEDCSTELLSKPNVTMDNLSAQSIPKLVSERLLSNVDDKTRIDTVKLLEEIIDEFGSNTTSG